MGIEFSEVLFSEFQKREKRFFAFMQNITDKNGTHCSNQLCTRNDEPVVYCPNGGKMAEILIPGAKCILSKYEGTWKWKWEAVCIDNVWIGTNPNNANTLAKDVLKIEWPNLEFQSEVSFKSYRADFVSEKIVVEVKNVHWKVKDIAYFPDCVTERGARQMLDLIELQKQGFQCFVIYIIQRNDVENFALADWIDKNYCINATKAYANGVKCLAYNCDISADGISIKNKLSIKF